ncbi:Leucine-rich repeat and immunoglobulin-like domain-containing nogo receptor-interacting protein 2, partial [Armadillidium vulgare]
MGYLFSSRGKKEIKMEREELCVWGMGREEGRRGECSVRQIFLVYTYNSRVSLYDRAYLCKHYVLVGLVLMTILKGISCIDVCETQLCDCEEDRADCKNKNLTEINDVLEFPNYITKIDLSSNNIPSLNTLDIDIKSDILEDLDISSNTMKIIDSSAFENINTSVLALNLRNNLINNIDEDTFYLMPTLVRLDLSYNQISVLPDGLFDEVGHLQHLDLSFNPIKELEETLFMHLKNLKRSTLVHQKNPPKICLFWQIVQEIGSGSFVGLSQLKVLILEQQLYLRKIDDYAFGHLTSLETFVLRYVPKIQRIPSKAFHINTANQTSGLKCPIRDLTLEFTTLSTIPED